MIFTSQWLLVWRNELGLRKTLNSLQNFTKPLKHFWKFFNSFSRKGTAAWKEAPTTSIITIVVITKHHHHHHQNEKRKTRKTQKTMNASLQIQQILEIFKNSSEVLWNSAKNSVFSVIPIGFFTPGATGRWKSLPETQKIWWSFKEIHCRTPPQMRRI